MTRRKLFVALVVLCVPVLLSASAADSRKGIAAGPAAPAAVESIAPLRESVSPQLLLATLGLGGIVVGRRVSSRF